MAYTTLNTQNKRNQLKAQLDDFATFQWRGHHMFDDFGCFIINEQKGSLKFYNGPSFTNQYAKTQFSSSVSAILGVDFKQQTIPMKVGLYWFTIEEYQEFLDCIGPYQVNYITFDFDDKYGYLVKSGKIADSTKYIIGTDENGEKRYYTELDLTWEVLGDACARSNLAYEYYSILNGDGNECLWSTKYPNNYEDANKANQYVGDMTDPSLLDTPLVFEMPCLFQPKTENKNRWSLKLEIIFPSKEIKIKDTNGNEQTQLLESKTYPLFDVELQNLSISEQSYIDTLKPWVDRYPQYQLYLRYDSETGLIYIQKGSLTSWELLNYQTDNSEGAPLLKSAEVFKYKLPGKFARSNWLTTECQFRLTCENIDLSNIAELQRHQAITIYSRKNVL